MNQSVAGEEGMKKCRWSPSGKHVRSQGANTPTRFVCQYCEEQIDPIPEERAGREETSEPRRCPDGCDFGERPMGEECLNCGNTDRKFARPLEMSEPHERKIVRDQRLLAKAIYNDLSRYLRQNNFSGLPADSVEVIVATIRKRKATTDPAHPAKREKDHK